MADTSSTEAPQHEPAHEIGHETDISKPLGTLMGPHAETKRQIPTPWGRNRVWCRDGPRRRNACLNTYINDGKRKRGGDVSVAPTGLGPTRRRRRTRCGGSRVRSQFWLVSVSCMLVKTDCYWFDRSQRIPHRKTRSVNQTPISLLTQSSVRVKSYMYSAARRWFTTVLNDFNGCLNRVQPVRQ